MNRLKQMQNIPKPDGKELGRVEAIINSMTAEERRRHEIITAGRRQRIARGVFRLGEGIAGRVARDWMPAMVNDADVHSGFVPKGQPVQRLLCVPLTYYDHERETVALFGVLNATRRPGAPPFTNDDIVQILVDTFLDERRAYSFICNPFGVQFDAVWTEGSGFDFSFDTVWESEGTLTDRGYVVRMAIPFRSLRFPRSPEQRWGLLFNRDVPRLNEETFWPRYSNRIQGRLNQTGLAPSTLTWMNNSSAFSATEGSPRTAMKAAISISACANMPWVLWSTAFPTMAV